MGETGAVMAYLLRLGLGEGAAARVAVSFSLEEAREAVRALAMGSGRASDFLEVALESAEVAALAEVLRGEGARRLWRTETEFDLRGRPMSGRRFALHAFEFLELLGIPPLESAETLLNVIEGRLPPDLTPSEILRAAAERMPADSDRGVLEEFLDSPRGSGTLAAMDEWVEVSRRVRIPRDERA